ncbi:MAG: hypoxanthine phosphoribosyltransferase [Myxococcota bacterium]
MGDQIERIEPMLSTAAIAARVRALGAEITADYRDQELIVVGVLKGSFLFFADLVRAIDVPKMSCDFLGLSSYGSRTESSGVVRLTSDLSRSVLDKHVLIVEDIVDTGLTMNYLLENFRARRPASLAVCTLLDKPAGRKIEVDVRYVGFTIEDQFVVGYGLDFDERHRQLPFIGVMHFDPVAQ